jgi:hypothetical protein
MEIATASLYHASGERSQFAPRRVSGSGFADENSGEGRHGRRLTRTGDGPAPVMSAQP